MKKSFILVIIILFFSLSLWGQDNNDQWIDPSNNMPSSGRAFPYYIETIPYSNYSFSTETSKIFGSEQFSSKIIILGWSRNGKVLLYYHNLFETTFYIVDLIEDNKISFGDDFYKKHGKSIEYAVAIDVDKYIKEIAQKYNIESVIGDIGEFPYIGSNGEKYSISVDEKMVEAEHTQLDIYLYKEFQPNKMKFVNTIGNEYAWDDTERDMLKFWFAKSPFENRIAVIPILPHWMAGAYDMYVYIINLYGSNLNVGFN